MTSQLASSRCVRWQSLCGAALLINFMVVAAICIELGVQEQVWWMSNVALVMGGTGLLLRSPILTMTALAGVFVPHVLWVTDCVSGFALGVHPLGVTMYLHDADALVWFKTLHHFYLVPMLMWAVLKDRRYPSALVPTVLGMFAILAIVSRLLLPATSNVNSAFAFLPGVPSPSLTWFNAFPAWRFVMVMIAGSLFMIVMPADMVLRRLTGARLVGQ